MRDTQVPEEARRHVTFRIKQSGLAALDELARSEQRSRGDMIRLLLADGIRNWQRRNT